MVLLEMVSITCWSLAYVPLVQESVVVVVPTRYYTMSCVAFCQVCLIHMGVPNNMSATSEILSTSDTPDWYKLSPPA